MGNAFGLKIRKINENSLLKDVVFGYDKFICEYVYFITKLNKFYVENFRRNVTINEFTLCNVFTRKEYNVVIERVECGFFFEGLEYSLEVIPTLDKVLYVSYVEEEGPGFLCGIRGKSTILLGNEQRYFSDLCDVEDEIKKMNGKFVFYDFEENSIKIIDFEEFRSKNSNEFRMGIELEVRNVKEINFENKKFERYSIKQEDKIKNFEGVNRETITTNLTNCIIENNYTSLGNDYPIEENKLIISDHDDGLSQQNESIKNSEAINNPQSLDLEFTFNKKEEKTIQFSEDFDSYETNDKNVKENQNIDNMKDENKLEDIRNNNYVDVNRFIDHNKEHVNKINILDCNSENFKIDIKPEQFLNSNLLIDSEKLGPPKSPKNNYTKENFHLDNLKENDETEINHNTDNFMKGNSFIREEISSLDCKVDLIESGSISNLTNPLCDSNLKNYEKITSASPLIKFKMEDNKIQIKSNNESSRFLTKCKKKYLKKLSIYEKIDSNYNFMSINKVPYSLIDTANTTPDRTKYETQDNSQKKQKRKVLIKGYYLSKNFESSQHNNYMNFKSLKILDLHQNTKNISIINSSNFI